MRHICAVPHRTEPYRLLDVRVLRGASDRGRFRWSVRERDGRVVEAGTHSYATEAEAFRAGNAAARAVRKRAQVPAGRGSYAEC
jgi:hypothetical protein